MKIEIEITLKDEPTNPGDFIFYRQFDGTPKIRKVKEKENWNGYFNDKGENSYPKVYFGKR